MCSSDLCARANALHALGFRRADQAFALAAIFIAIQPPAAEEIADGCTNRADGFADGIAGFAGTRIFFGLDARIDLVDGRVRRGGSPFASAEGRCRARTPGRARPDALHALGHGHTGHSPAGVILTARGHGQVGKKSADRQFI